MDIARFKKLYARFNKFPLPKEEWNTSEYEEYNHAIDNDEVCSRYYLEKRLEDRNFFDRDYCCLEMAYHLAFPGDRNDVDQIIDRFLANKKFGIPIHDGGSSHIEIKFCPWCGTELSTIS